MLGTQGQWARGSSGFSWGRFHFAGGRSRLGSDQAGLGSKGLDPMSEGVHLWVNFSLAIV